MVYTCRRKTPAPKSESLVNKIHLILLWTVGDNIDNNPDIKKANCKFSTRTKQRGQNLSNIRLIRSNLSESWSWLWIVIFGFYGIGKSTDFCSIQSEVSPNQSVSINQGKITENPIQSQSFNQNQNHWSWKRTISKLSQSQGCRIVNKTEEYVVVRDEYCTWE